MEKAPLPPCPIPAKTFVLVSARELAGGGRLGAQWSPEDLSAGQRASPIHQEGVVCMRWGRGSILFKDRGRRLGTRRDAQGPCPPDPDRKARLPVAVGLACRGMPEESVPEPGGEGG